MRSDSTLLPNRAGDEARALLRWQNRAEFAEEEADRYRAALEEMANADLKRTNAGWLQDAALRALGRQVLK